MNVNIPDDLYKKLGHRFACPQLLEEALTHPSADETYSYERMEFLGDRVLGLVVADWLFDLYPSEPAGDLAVRYNELVRGEQLAEIAENLGLGTYMRIGKGETEALKHKSAMLTDVCEAVIAALYLDGGMEPARAFIRDHWASAVEAQTAPPKDAKSELQEWAMARGQPLPAYREVERRGPQHALEFTMEVSVLGVDPEIGTGPSKKAAESEAAGMLLSRLRAKK